MMSNSKRKKQLTFSTAKVVGIFLLTFMVFTSSHAQVGGGGGDETDVPFDGGITLLLGAGVAYGIKEWKKKKDNAQENEII